MYASVNIVVVEDVLGLIDPRPATGSLLQMSEAIVKAMHMDVYETGCH